MDPDRAVSDSIRVRVAAARISLVSVAMTPAVGIGKKERRPSNGGSGRRKSTGDLNLRSDDTPHILQF